jgi:hypothetical protein
MANNHQVARNSARQIRTNEHYKFKNVCQLPCFKSGHFDRENEEKTATSRDLTVFSR